MAIRDLVPWGRKSEVPVRREADHPFVSLHREMNRLFDSFFRDFGIGPFGMSERMPEDFSPPVNVTEDEKEIRVSAELPGIDEKDVDVTLTGDSITIKGEKKDEREETRGGCHRVERSYGSFERIIPLPAGVEEADAKAEFAKGVLTVTIPRSTDQAKVGRKIEVKRG
jgi:HSP20 family protein